MTSTAYGHQIQNRPMTINKASRKGRLGEVKMDCAADDSWGCSDCAKQTPSFLVRGLRVSRVKKRGVVRESIRLHLLLLSLYTRSHVSIPRDTGPRRGFVARSGERC